jgi:sarcosine oxidase, subunit beta
MPVHYGSELPSSADVVIVGGGAVGAATAFYAARAGLHPLLIERRARLCSLTTPVAAGAFRLQVDTIEELVLIRESVELFLHFEEITRQREYHSGVRQQGYLWLTTSEDGAARQRQLVALQHQWGQTDIELLDGAEVRRRFPYVGTNVVQARFRAGDGFLDQKQLTVGLIAASGAEVVTGCEVTGFEITGGRLRGVRTAHGMVATAAAVIAAGPFSGVVADRAGVSLPIETVVRQKVIVPDLPAVPATAPMVIDEDTGAHWRPALRGAFLLFADPATPPSPPTEDVTPEQRFAFQLLDPTSPVALSRITPFWQRVWDYSATHWVIQAGQYTMTPDHRPIIDETPVAGLFVNTGYSGHGIMGGPAGSKLLLEVLTGRRASAENPFRLLRSFAAPERVVL